jgi:hypothetical protein
MQRLISINSPIYSIALSIAILSSSSGCAFIDRLRAPGFGAGARSIASAKGRDPAVTPVRLDILEESNDGTQLTVKGAITPKEELNSNELVVRLAGITATGEERVAFKSASDISGSAAKDRKLSPKDGPTKFTLSLPSVGLSNYQVEVLWGRDAEAYLPKNGPDMRASLKNGTSDSKDFLALRELEVHRIPDGSCSSPEECLVTFSIKGEIFNSGRGLVREVTLEAGFAPATKVGIPHVTLEGSKKIEIQGLELAPGAVKPFRLTLEKLLPASDTVAYQPVVRIERFETDW